MRCFLTHPDSQPNYEGLSRALAAAGSSLSAAEAHGVLAGVLAAASPGRELPWRDLILEPGRADVDEATYEQAARLLATLAAGIERQLEDRRFEFELLLPCEDTDLEMRVRALAEWCRGLLLGLVAAGAKEAYKLPGEAGEAVRDLIQIAEVELGEEGDSGEAAERAFAELVEYVRAGVQILYEEFHP